MGIKTRIAMAIGDHYQTHGCRPRRITVSREVARELDAAMMADQEIFNPGQTHKSPTPLQDGNGVWFQGVLVVADMDPGKVLDIR